VPVLAEVITENCCHAPGTTGVTFAEFKPCAGASYGATYTLIDDRDDKQYKVKYMPDGRYWMVQDLKFGNCNTTSFKIDNSENATQVEPTVSTGYVGHCRTNGQASAGYYYSWAGAMNNKLAYRGNSNHSYECTGVTNVNTCRGVCPASWHLPSGDNNGEYAALLSALMAGKSCSNYSCWNANSMWEGQPMGRVKGDAIVDTSFYSWYSSTWDSSWSTAARGPSLTETSYEWINWMSDEGLPVRCVMNY
jgi:uncharacterized protein (TIGR02145 family)